MFSKVKTFSLLATALIIAPSAAFAEDLQGNQQNITQIGIASGRNNTVINNARQQSIKNITNVGNSCGTAGSNAQLSNQNINQVGIAVGENNVAVNKAEQLSIQNLIKASNGYCH